MDFLTNVKIKKEKVTPPVSPTKSPELPLAPTKSTTTNDCNENNNATTITVTKIKIEKPDENETACETKPNEPIKSSSELLAELFKVFNAVPPKAIDTNDSGKSKKSKKKHKKHKKKHKKRGRSSSDEDDQDDQDNEADNEKRRKERRKRKKLNRSPSNGKDKGERKRTKSRTKSPITFIEDVKPVIKQEKSHHRECAHKKHRKHKSSNANKDEPSKYADLDIEEYEKKLLESEKPSSTSTSKHHDNGESSSSAAKKGKIVIKSLKNSAVYAETVSQVEENERNKRKPAEEDGELPESISSRSSSISLSDEETYLKNREKYYGRSSDYYSSSSSYRYNDRDRYDRDRRHHHHHHNNRNDDHFYDRRSHRSRRSRSRSRRRDSPPEEDRIDKKRLLEIARKNAISMFKNGMLPGIQNMAPETKERVLTKMRYGGKTVDELTEFCKKLSNGESNGYLSNISDESDHDREGNEKAFNHPFVLKDRGPIIMNIKNSTPIQPKTAEETKAILSQFPVSSGQHHRQNENEWIPVVPKKPEQAKKTLSETFKVPDISVSKHSIDQISSTKLPTTPLPVPAPTNPPIAIQQPEPMAPVAFEKSIEQEKSNVFGNMMTTQKLDVSSIISNRLNAMRKLQDNPLDHEAIKTMYTTQKDMSTWANSKFVPGQFTGSTGANILTPRELTSGFQAWAKRDQMITSQPVSGGMGMHILQKMGWKPGEGLGKERNGSLQPLLLEVKLDKKGLLANEEDQSQQSKRRRPQNIAQAKQTMESKHPVSLLGELAAKRKWLAPLYEQIYESGPSHSRQFYFKVTLNGNVYQSQTPCNNKKDAKASAARFALHEMGILS